VRFLTLASLAVASAVALAAPASAAVTTFASFSPIGNATNIRWVGSSNNAAGNFGRNATFYTTATGNGNVAAARSVNFSFLQPAISPFITNVTAMFMLNGTVTNTIATLNGVDIVQSNISGSFSFTSTSLITIGSTNFLPGSNLLSGTFGNTVLSGTRNGSAAGWNGSTPTASLVYSSAFLSFDPMFDDYDMAWSLTSSNPLLNAFGPGNSLVNTPNRALRSFRAVLGGQFSSDPAPMTPTIPEPAVWAQLILGFSMVGFAARRRKITVAA